MRLLVKAAAVEVKVSIRDRMVVLIIAVTIY